MCIHDADQKLKFPFGKRKPKQKPEEVETEEKRDSLDSGAVTESVQSEPPADGSLLSLGPPQEEPQAGSSQQQEPPKPKPPLAPQIDGVFRLIKSENMGPFMKQIGVNALIRKLGSSPTSMIDAKYDKDTETYWVLLKIGPKKQMNHFKLGVPFDEKTIDGRKCKTLVTAQNETTLLQEQHWKKGTCTMLSEFRGDKAFITLRSGNIVATQVYQKLAPGAKKIK